MTNYRVCGILIIDPVIIIIGGQAMKLFKVKFQTSNTSNIFYAFVIAGNETEAEKIVEEEIWSLGGIMILSVTEEEMKEYPRVICTCSQDDV